MTSLLPPHSGLLPYWLILTSSLSILNTVQCYRTRSHALRTYQGPLANAQVTNFGSRMFGTWTLLSCVIRLYAAYKVDVQEVYVMAMWTYGIALAHFGTEWGVFGTMKVGRGLAPVLAVAVGSLVWMGLQWGYYVQ